MNEKKCGVAGVVDFNVRSWAPEMSTRKRSMHHSHRQTNIHYKIGIPPFNFRYNSFSGDLNSLGKYLWNLIDLNFYTENIPIVRWREFSEMFE